LKVIKEHDAYTWPYIYYIILNFHIHTSIVERQRKMTCGTDDLNTLRK